MLDTMLEAAREGIDAAPGGSPTAHRLQEMRDFYAYMVRELPALIENWRKQHRGGDHARSPLMPISPGRPPVETVSQQASRTARLGRSRSLVRPRRFRRCDSPLPRPGHGLECDGSSRWAEQTARPDHERLAVDVLDGLPSIR